MIDNELIQQFQRCQEWNDAQQWEELALQYYSRGYYLNAKYCFEQADLCRFSLHEYQPVVSLGG